MKNISKGVIIALGVSGVVIIGLIVAVVILLNRPTTVTEDTESKRNVVVTQDNVDEVIAEMDDTERVQPGSYEVTMNTTWQFSDGKSPSSNAYVENSTDNTNDVYFDIKLADTDETIYSSPVLPVGSHLEDITLDKELEDGTYDCVITYTLVDENQNDLSSVNVSMTIVVGE